MGSRRIREARWRHDAPSDVYVLAIDELGHVWAGAAREASGGHAVVRLSSGLRGGWELDGVIRGHGSLRRDGAYANDRGLSLAILDGPRARPRSSVIGYAGADLRRHPRIEPWL